MSGHAAGVVALIGESRRMRKLLPVLLIAAGLTPASAGWQHPLTTTTGRVAAVRVGDPSTEPVRGLIRMTVGERVQEGTMAISPVREVCLEVVEGATRLVDAVCAPAEIFIDDLWQVASGSGTLASTVTNEWGLWVADSTITFSARLTRDALAGCTPPAGGTPLGTNIYASGPFVPGYTAEAELECAAETEATLSSSYLGEATGGATGILGPYTGSAWRYPDISPDAVVIGGRSIVGQEETWDQPIVVPPGGSLIVLDSTIWLDWRPPICTQGSAGYCHANITVLPGGRLVVKDSTFDTRLWDEHNGNTGFAIAVFGGHVEFEGSTFQHHRNIIVQGNSPTPSTVTDSEFHWAANALSFIRGAEATVEDSTFSHNLIGLAMRDTTGAIRNNHFHDNIRYFQPSGFGRAIDVQHSIAGEKAWQTTPLVENNLVEDGYQGMLNLNGFANEVRGNTFRNHSLVGASIGLSGGDDTFNHATPVWEANRFVGNQTALNVYVSGAPQGDPISLTPELRGNSFVGTHCVEIEAQTLPGVNLSVDANGNWWGSSAGPQSRGAGCPAFVGDVIADTWLSEAP